MTTQGAGVNRNCPKSYLILSAVGEVSRETVEGPTDPATIIERALERIDRSRTHRQRRRRVDRLIRFVWGAA